MTPQLTEHNGIRLAIEGCGHGTLHAIYASVATACAARCWPSIDLLIIGGDFQSVRNAHDLHCVSMPAKYRSMCDFHEYYSRQKTAPYLTIFVGGNHEASNSLFELYYGGWVAPKIYYMGAANVLRVGPLRIAGMSGIWKGYNYRKPHFERLPYTASDVKSVYHTRELDVRKLMQIRSQVDVGVSHDWPKGVEWMGDWKGLFRRKRFLEEDARSGQLGSVAAKQVLDRLRPRYWFSAHLHCKYAAVVEHGLARDVGGTDAQAGKGAANGQTIKNEDEIDLEMDDDEEASAPPGAKVTNADEIDLDLDDDEEAQNGQAPPQVVKVSNADEIDLELEDDEDGVASVAPGQGLDNVAVQTTSKQPSTTTPAVDLEAARALLPAAFARPERKVVEVVEHPPDITNTTTQFLALDKCLPHTEFLQVLEVPTEHTVERTKPLILQYDREWLAITRAFTLHEPPIFGDPDAAVPPPKSQSEYAKLIDEQLQWVEQNISENDLTVPESFEVTAPVYDGGDWTLPEYSSVEEYPNPQTEKFCKMLGVKNPLHVDAEALAARQAAGPRYEPDAERFAANGRGAFRGRGGRGHGGHRGGGGGGGRGRGRGGGRGGFRGH